MEAKETIWKPIEEVNLASLPEGAEVLTDRREVIYKEDGCWWQHDGIVANVKNIKKVIVIPE